LGERLGRPKLGDGHKEKLRTAPCIGETGHAVSDATKIRDVNIKNPDG
jgi:hypothetical protein